MKNKIHKTPILTLCLFALLFAVQAQFPNFTRVDTGSIYVSEGSLAHVSGILFDIDNDGDQDLMNPNWMGTQFTLYNNDGHGNFENQNTLSQLYGSTNVFFDLDNDSFLDILHFHNEMSRVYYNDGQGNFEDYTNLNIPCLDPNAVLHNIALGDADNDGDFDLYFGYSSFSGSSLAAKNEFFLNQGSGVFERHSEDSIIVQDLAMTTNSNWIDYDNDGDMDLYVLNTFNYDPSESISGALFENKGDLVFEKHTIEPAGYRDANRISSVWGDLDNDADLDLYITIEKNDFNGHVSPIKHNLLMQNNGDGTFPVRTSYGVGEYPHSVVLSDLDGDGYDDIIVANLDSRHHRHDLWADCNILLRILPEFLLHGENVGLSNNRTDSGFNTQFDAGEYNGRRCLCVSLCSHCQFVSSAACANYDGHRTLCRPLLYFPDILFYGSY